MNCLPTIARSLMIMCGGGDKYGMSFDSNTTNHFYWKPTMARSLMVWYLLMMWEVSVEALLAGDFCIRSWALTPADSTICSNDTTSW